MKSWWNWTCAAAVAWAAATPGAEAADHSDNVVIVLDASGSMKGALQGTSMDRMSAAKASLKAVLQRVPPTTHIGLLVFSARNAPAGDWFYPLRPRDDAALLRAIDSIEPHGSTPLGRYIKMGADRLLEERAKQFGYGSYRLLIVTDGEAQDRQLVDRYTPEVIARGITVDVIGVAMSQNHTLATRVHSYRRANDPAALNRALAEVFAEVSASARDSAAEGFELLAPLPSQVALAMIQGLAAAPNHPIGERPQPSVSGAPSVPQTQPNRQTAPPGPQGSAPAAVGGGSSATPNLPQSQPPAPASRRKKGTSAWLVAVVVIALFAVSKAIRSKR